MALEADCCPLCGSNVTAGEGESGASASVPWEDPTVGFPANLLKNWEESVFRPAAFFQRVDFAGPFGRPLLYFLIISILASMFNLIWVNLFWNALFSSLSDTLGSAGFGVQTMRANVALQFFWAPFGALLALGLGTLVLHLFTLMLAPERRNMGATARVVCYSRGPLLWSIVPIIGSLVGWVWALVLAIQGMRAAHRTSTGRAVAIVLLPWGLLVLLAIGLGLLLAVVMAVAGGGAS